jgi:response regulator RpfG family c-di-GMP phosphodiesterase
MAKEKIHILFVDDEVKEYSRQIRKMTAALGYELDSSPHIKDALEKVKSKRYNMIVCDLSMPSKNQPINPIQFLSLCEKKYGSHPLIYSLKKGDRSNFAGLPYAWKLDWEWVLEHLIKLKHEPWSHKKRKVNLKVKTSGPHKKARGKKEWLNISNARLASKISDLEHNQKYNQSERQRSIRNLTRNTTQTVEIPGALSKMDQMLKNALNNLKKRRRR